MILAPFVDLLRRKARTAKEEDINRIQDLLEADSLLAERMDEWFNEVERKATEVGLAKGIQEGMQQGMQQGLQIGERLLLSRQLTKRFGELSEEIQAFIANANTDQLELWGDRILDATLLSDVFKDS